VSGHPTPRPTDSSPRSAGWPCHVRRPEDAVQPLTHHLLVRMIGLAPAIDQAARQPTRVAPAMIKLADRHQPRIAADRLRSRLDNDGLLCENTEAELIDRLCQHHAVSVRFELWLGNRVRIHKGRFFKSAVNNAGSSRCGCAEADRTARPDTRRRREEPCRSRRGTAVQASRSMREGVSIASRMRSRQRTASRPSTMRWS